MILNYKTAVLFIVVCLKVNTAFGQEVFNISSPNTSIPGEYLEYCQIDEKTNSIKKLEDLIFIKNNNSMLNLGISDNTYAIRMNLVNNTNDSLIRINIPIAYIDYVTLLYYDQKGNQITLRSGERISSSIKQVDDPYQSFIIPIGQNPRKIYFIVKSSEQLIFPVSIISLNEPFTTRSIFFGIFCGVILALFLYNLVLAFLLQEQVYYIYLIFLFSIFFAQANLIGLSHYFLSPWPALNHYSVYFFSALVGLSAIRFMEKFLDISIVLPKARIYIVVGYIMYTFLLILPFLEIGSFAYIVMQLSGMYASVLALSIATILTLRGSILAKFYLAAWSIFSVGIIIFVLKDYSILPFNNFTRLTMIYGVIIEVILLSIALAHRINTLKKDNEKAQERIIEEMSRNENLIKNQNIILEEKVKTRTEELEHTLNNLKKAQVKLVESEKMASLGVLTSGIAHEINNPINYVSANVVPLRDNIQALTKLINTYKELNPDNFDEKSQEIIQMEKDIELDYTLTETSELIDGIEEGAKRTYNIVDGLRTFSRSDTTSKRKSNINKGLESTLSVLKSQIKAVTLEIDLDSSIPLVDCQLGKLNQVFLNLINNAIQAIEEKYPDNLKSGILGIKTYQIGTLVNIEISDNGSGIPEESKSKIFEPFFTSKPVGKGTGLGLSISYSIVEDHNGSLSFQSEENHGTVFKIELPIES